jgi:hypothetical protein
MKLLPFLFLIVQNFIVIKIEASDPSYLDKKSNFGITLQSNFSQNSTQIESNSNLIQQQQEQSKTSDFSSSSSSSTISPSSGSPSSGNSSSSQQEYIFTDTISIELATLVNDLKLQIITAYANHNEYIACKLQYLIHSYLATALKLENRDKEEKYQLSLAAMLKEKLTSIQNRPDLKK